MTIASTATRKEYVGNGVTTAFAFPYPFAASTDLVVYERTIATGAIVKKTYGSDYTVSGAGDPSGGTVTAAAAPANTLQWIILRDPAISQGVALVNGEKIDVDAAINDPLDALTLMVQRQNDRNDRAIHAPDGDLTADADMELPNSKTRANTFLGFDGSGLPAVFSAIPTGTNVGALTKKLYASAYASVTAGDTDAAGKDAVLSMDNSETLSADTDYAARIFGEGGTITRGSYNVSGNFWAPPYVQMFDNDGTGIVTFKGVSEIHVGWFGLTLNDNSADACAANARAIQAAIDAAYQSATSEPGGTEVVFPAGYIYSDALVQKSGVRWKGAGKNSTILRPNPSLTGKFIKTLNFDTLTGQNKWLVSDGVQYGFGFDDMMIDGTGLSGTCSGLAIYGKGYFIGDDFSVQNFTDQNIYSECGYVGGQDDYRDMPEGCASFDVRGSTNEGLVFRGPHDMIVRRVVQADCGIDGGKKGVVFETDGSTYSGSCNIGSIHSYTTGDDAIYINCFVTADLLVGETTPKHAIEFGTRAAGSLIGKVEVFAFDSGGTGNYSGVYDAGGVTIKELWGRKQYTCHSVVNQAVAGSRVGGAVIRNLGTGAGRGVYMGASNTRFEGSINGLNQTGDIGVEVATNLSGIRIDADVQNCTTHLKVGASQMQRSVVDITGFINSGQTFYSGPVSPGTDNHWRVTSTDGTTRQRSKYSAKQADVIDLTSATVQTVTFTHNLFLTPNDYQCEFTGIKGSTVGDDAEWTLRLDSVSATQAVAKVSVKTASATSGAKLSVGLRVDLGGG